MKFFPIALFFIFPVGASAAVVDCESTEIDQLFVIGSRTDSSNQEKLQVSLPTDCVAGKSFGFIDNNEPAYQGMLSMLLAAKLSGTPVRLRLDDAVSTASPGIS